MHGKYNYKFDALKLIKRMGGATKMHRILNQHGADIRLKAVQKMSERNLIQSDVLATLMVASKKMGDPINPYDYLLEREQ